MKSIRIIFLPAILAVSLSLVSQNNCLEFGGLSGYVDCGSGTSLKINDNTISVEAWIYPQNFKSYVWLNTILANDYWSGSNSEGYVFRFGAPSGDLDFTFSYAGGSYWASTTAVGVLVEDQWQHVAAVYDGSTVKLYVNGSEVTSQNYSSNIIYSSQNLNLGRSTGDPTGRMLDGRLDEVRIWDDARTGAEIRSGMYTELTGNESGLLAYYQFNQTTGTTLPDLAGSNTGILHNLYEFSWVTSAALYGPGKSLGLNGSSHYVLLNNAAALAGLTSLTVESWIKTNSTNDWQEILHRQDQVGNPNSIAFGLYNGTGLYCYINSGTTGAASTTIPNVVTLNEWTHVAVTWQASNGENILYVNGEQVGSLNGSTEALCAVGSGNTFIGTLAGSTEFFSGELDELRVWNAVRTPHEIRENMCRNLTGNETGLIAYYTFDHYYGNTVVDYSGSENYGTCLGASSTLSGVIDWTDWEVKFRDYEAGWTPGALVGLTVSITTPGKEQDHLIGANTDVEITIDLSEWFWPIIGPGDTYEVVVPGGATSWNASAAYNMWLSSDYESWSEQDNWSLGERPQPWDNAGVYFMYGGVNPVIYSDIYEPWSCNNLVIGTGATATIPPANGFDVFGNLINHGTLLLQCDASGTASIINHGSLLGSGTWQAERYLTANQWCNFSPPFSDMISGNFELPQVEDPDVFILKNIEESYSYEYIVDDNVNLNAMQGYMIWVDGDEATPNVNSWTFTFEGTPSTGLVGQSDNLIMTEPGGFYRGWNFVGNPYLSPIDWAASSGWTKSGVEATTYIYAGSGNWATYTSGSELSTNGGSRYIPPAQAFFVKVTDPLAGYPHTATLTMDNNVRVHYTNSYLKETSAPDGLVKLQLSNGLHTDEINISIGEPATFEFDPEYDAHKLFSYNENLPQFFSYGPTELATNCIPEAQPVNLGVYSNQTHEALTIAVLENEQNLELYLEDKLLKTITQLNQQAYHFAFVPEQPERFVLHFAPVGTNQQQQIENLRVFASGSTLYINGQTGGAKYHMQVYDMLGHQLFARHLDDQNHQISLQLETGLYLVKISHHSKSFMHKVFVK